MDEHDYTKNELNFILKEFFPAFSLLLKNNISSNFLESVKDLNLNFISLVGCSVLTTPSYKY